MTDADGKEVDKLFITMTSGSDGTGRTKQLGTVVIRDGEAMFIPLAPGKVKL